MDGAQCVAACCVFKQVAPVDLNSSENGYDFMLTLESASLFSFLRDKRIHCWNAASWKEEFGEGAISLVTHYVSTSPGARTWRPLTIVGCTETKIRIRALFYSYFNKKLKPAFLYLCASSCVIVVTPENEPPASALTEVPKSLLPLIQQAPLSQANPATPSTYLPLLSRACKCTPVMRGAKSCFGSLPEFANTQVE